MNIQFEPGDALLIVDAQNDFFPEGSLGVPNGDQIIPILNEMIANAKQNNIPIIASRDWHPADHCSFKEQGGRWPVHCVQFTEGAAFHDDVNIPISAIVVNKAFEKNHEAYSAFEGHTDDDNKLLPEKLKELRVKRLWVGGLALDYCVKYTVLDAAKNHFDINVVLDATKAIETNKQDDVIAEIKSAGAKVIRMKLTEKI